MPKFLDALAGFAVTFSSMFKKTLTEQYPEKPGPVAPRYHGRHQLNRYPDGLEKCIGCELCAWACPTRALTMTNQYEMADDNRADLIWGKDKLLAPLQPGMQAPPHDMAPGSTDDDYYLGRINPLTEDVQ